MLGSGRPGGVDVSFFGLARQTFRDFEVVFVDSRYHTRHARVLDAWERANDEAGTRVPAPLFHVPNHRNQAPPWGTTCAGYNTSSMLADGELVVFLLDFGFAPSDWLQRHVDAHEGKRRLVLAPHVYYDMPPVVTLDGGPPIDEAAWSGKTPEQLYAERARYDEISIFPEPGFRPEILGPPVGGDPKIVMPEGPCLPDFFHTKNESFPLDAILDVNGMDEHFDRMRGPGDPELAYRLVRAGLEPWLVHAPVLCPNPRAMLPNPNSASHYDRPTPGHEWRLDYLAGERYFRQSVEEGRTRALNPYDLRERREKIWHWRALSQERAAVIPDIVVPDSDYFGAA